MHNVPYQYVNVVSQQTFLFRDQSNLSKAHTHHCGTPETMSNLSHQIKQSLSQPDRDASRLKAFNHINANHAFSQPTSALADAVQNMRHERDTLRVSVRFSPML